MYFVDIIIIIIFAIGLLEGWKKGLITSLIKLTSSIIIFVLAYLLKGPLSLVLMEHLPFISFDGIFKGITSINILVYEGIAFFIITFVLGILFKIILKLSGIFNKALNMTIILGLPNKIGGALINGIRFVIIIFISIFILNLIPITTEYINKSVLSKIILNDTPILSGYTNNVTKSLNDIYDLAKKIDKNTDKDKIDQDIIDILLKYDIISEETLSNLIQDGKINTGKEDKND